MVTRKRIDLPFLTVLLIAFASIAIFIKHRNVLTGIFVIKTEAPVYFKAQSYLVANGQSPDLLPLLAVFLVLIIGLLLLSSHKRKGTHGIYFGLITILLLSTGVLIAVNEIFNFVSSELQKGQLNAYASLGNLLICIIYMVLYALTGLLSVVLFSIFHLHLLVAYIHYPILGVLTVSTLSFVPEVIVTSTEEKQEAKEKKPSKFQSAFERFMGFLFYVFFPIRPPKSPKTPTETANQPANTTNNDKASTNSEQSTESSPPIGGTMAKESKDTNETTEQPTEPAPVARQGNNRNEPLTTMEKISGKLQEYVAKSGGNGFLGRFFNSARHKYVMEKQIEQEKRETEFYKAQTEKVTATTDWMKAHINLNNTSREKQRNDNQQDILDMQSKEELDINTEIYTDPEIKELKIETEKQKIKNQLLQQQKIAAQLKNDLENASTATSTKEETDDSTLGQKLAKIKKLQEDKRKQENKINTDPYLTETERKEQIDSLEKTFQREKTKIELGFGAFEED